MCLLVFAFDSHPSYQLVFAGNRDEFHARPAAPPCWWEDLPGLLAGRDLEAGGTWVGLTRVGRFGVVTNYREIASEPAAPRSRGELIPAFARFEGTGRDHMEELEAEAPGYAGFNLIFGDLEELHYFSNRGPSNREARSSPLSAGVHGLSNHQLDTPWPKLERTRRLFATTLEQNHIDPDDLLALLADRTPTPDRELPHTGIGLEWERLLSSPFIVSPEYGTRCSTTILVSRLGEATFVERSFDAEGRETGTVRFDFLVANTSRKTT